MAGRPKPLGAGLRAELAQLDLIEQAHAAVRAAIEHRDQLIADSLAARLVTQPQVAQVLDISVRGLRKRLGPLRSHDPMAAVAAAEQERADGDA